MKTFKQHILEKLKINKSSYKMTLKEFAKERQSLNDPKNDVKLTVKVVYDTNIIETKYL